MEKSPRLVLNPGNWAEALKPLAKEKPVALKMESLEIPCGGLCGFKVKNGMGLKTHRSSCSIYSTSMGRTIPTVTCICGRQCKGEKGLKTHQRSCRKYKKGKKGRGHGEEQERMQLHEEEPNVRMNTATGEQGGADSNAIVSSRSWIALAWERCRWPWR